ncbi:MAG TPA: hypothetical protein VFR23_08235 [Jiangellaceae bacterium]|nr:hypothetical protein [Jiangellaceae bacterium]
MMRRVIDWWITPIPLARIAFLRIAVYLFLIYDVLRLSNDVIPQGYAPELYDPTFLARFFQLPAPTPEVGQALRVIIVVGTIIVASGRLPRIGGWIVAAAFQVWLLYSIGFGYVYHDHMALAIACWVLPTVGRAGFHDQRESEAAGWAIRCIQLAVVLTYFGSAFMKWIRAGSPITWANSSVFTWAIMRRGSDLARWTLEQPMILRAVQWLIILAEFASPIVLFLRGRLLAFAIVFFLSFHLMTFLALGIHFLPTVICWLAFMPLERLVPWAQRHTAARLRRERRQPANPEPIA